MEGHTRYLLADKKHVYSAEVKVVKEGQGGQAVISRVLACIKLRRGIQVSESNGLSTGFRVLATYHDCLSLVLDNMTGPANLVATAQAQEHQLIGGIDWLLGRSRCHRRGLPLGSHGERRDPVAGGPNLNVYLREPRRQE